ncbi:MAG: glutathione S-transferase family protein [Pseudomonadales bacterium]
MLQLHEMADSGNCYKVRLLLNLLDRPYERKPVDILKGESRTSEFLALNPNGRVPLLVLDDGRTLPESNAILWYLADGSPWLPTDAFERAQVLQWMFFEQYSHEPFIATNRFWIHIQGSADANAEKIAANHPRGLAALGVMETHLAGREWFVGSACSIADIALYAYTHVAHQGGFDLAPFAALRGWLERVAAQPRHIPITA